MTCRNEEKRRKRMTEEEENEEERGGLCDTQRNEIAMVEKSIEKEEEKEEVEREGGEKSIEKEEKGGEKEEKEEEEREEGEKSMEKEKKERGEEERGERDHSEDTHLSQEDAVQISTMLDNDEEGEDIESNRIFQRAFTTAIITCLLIGESVQLGLGDFIFYSLMVSKASLSSTVPFVFVFIIILAVLDYYLSSWLFMSRDCLLQWHY